MSRKINLRCVRLISALLVLGLAAGCAQLKPVADSLDVSKPTAKVGGFSVTGLSFDQVDLQFMLDVRNDNAIGLDLAGLEYDFQLAGRSIVSGRQDLAVSLDAKAVSRIPLAVSLRYSELKSALGALLDQDQLAYALTGKLGVDLPVLGRQDLPLSATGSLPVPKMPRVRLAGISLGQVGLTGAEVQVQVTIENPNSFDVELSGMDLDLAVNEQPWGSALVAEKLQIAQKAETRLTIPLSLEFARIGQSGFQLLVRRERFDYRLQGSVVLDTALPMLQDLTLPIDFSGRGLSL